MAQNNRHAARRLGGQQQQQQQRQQQTAHALSRFVEASMNDRVSTAPPTDFLGPEAACATSGDSDSDGNEDSDDEDDAVMARKPRSTPAEEGIPFPRSPCRRPLNKKTNVGQTQPSEKTGFFGPLLDGVRHLLPRWRPSGCATGLGGGKENKEKRVMHAVAQQAQEQAQVQPPQPPQQQQQQQQQKPLAEAMAADVDRYPDRDEVLASYKRLMASGFFSAHTTQSTRHAPPGGMPRPPRPLQPTDGNATRLPPATARPREAVNNSRGIRKVAVEPEQQQQQQQQPNLGVSSGARKLVKTLRRSTSRLARGGPPPARRQRGLASNHDGGDAAFFEVPARITSKKPSAKAGAATFTRLDTVIEGGVVRRRQSPRLSAVRSSSSRGPHPSRPLRPDSASSAGSYFITGVDELLAMPLPHATSSLARKGPAPSPSRQFHYPNRPPVPVRPNTSRGIPTVPRIPAQFSSSARDHRHPGLGHELDDICDEAW